MNKSEKKEKFYQTSDSTLVRINRKVYMQLADIAEKQKMNPRLFIEKILTEYCEEKYGLKS